DYADRAFGNAAELDDPLGDQIHVAFDRLVDVVEQLVKSDERRALHVPVRLLALCLQIDALGEALVEERNHLETDRLRQIILRRVEPRRFALAPGRHGRLLGDARGRRASAAAILAAAAVFAASSSGASHEGSPESLGNLRSNG